MNRLALIISLLLLIFFVGTSSGFADLSSIQEKLREIQVKLIGEKIKLIQEQIIEAGKQKVKEDAISPASAPESAVSREELSRNIENQIKILGNVILSLKPKAVEEETARLEKRIAEIRSEIEKATGGRLLELQDELGQVLSDYNKLEQDVTQSLEDSLKQKQTIVLQEQIRLLQEKVRLLPQPVVVMPKSASIDEQAQLKSLQEQVEKVRLKLLQQQVKVLQEKIEQVGQ